MFSFTPIRFDKDGNVLGTLRMATGSFFTDELNGDRLDY